MRGSFRIAKFFNIPVELHWTFGLLLIWIVFASVDNGADWMNIIWNFIFVIALFLCVVLHEFGHALTARRYGVNTKDIILSPIGGIARLDRLPEKPVHEFLVAAAGPAVNVAIALILSPYFLIAPDPGFFQKVFNGSIFENGIGFIPALILLNMILAGFNMLPAFPMDGGRILRALLSIRLGKLKATRIASWIGQSLAVALIFYAIWSSSFVTALIGIFVFFTANQEYQAVKLSDMLTRYRVEQIMRMQFTKLNHYDPISQVGVLLNNGMERSFLVVDDEDNILGSVDEKKLIATLKASQSDHRIGEFVKPAPPALSKNDSLKKAYETFYSSDHDILPVVENGVWIAVADIYGLNYFLSLRKKLKSG